MLTEQAAAYSGAADEARNADRIAERHRRTTAGDAGSARPVSGRLLQEGPHIAEITRSRRQPSFRVSGHERLGKKKGAVIPPSRRRRAARTPAGGVGGAACHREGGGRWPNQASPGPGARAVPHSTSFRFVRAHGGLNASTPRIAAPAHSYGVDLFGAA
jgi:hypothetical protein